MRWTRFNSWLVTQTALSVAATLEGESMSMDATTALLEGSMRWTRLSGESITQTDCVQPHG